MNDLSPRLLLGRTGVRSRARCGPPSSPLGKVVRPVTGDLRPGTVAKGQLISDCRNRTPFRRYKRLAEGEKGVMNSRESCQSFRVRPLFDTERACARHTRTGGGGAREWEFRRAGWCLVQTRESAPRHSAHAASLTKLASDGTSRRKSQSSRAVCSLAPFLNTVLQDALLQGVQTRGEKSRCCVRVEFAAADACGVRASSPALRMYSSDELPTNLVALR